MWSDLDSVSRSVVEWYHKHQPLCLLARAGFLLTRNPMRGSVKYEKPHLEFSQQLDLLSSRGLEISDTSAAEGVLRRLGYYRFAAYAYPFRQLLEPDAPRGSSVQHRTDAFVPGTRFEWIADLASFDRQLRLVLLEGLECFELALRVQVAYVLGRRSAFVHLEPEHLEQTALDVPSQSAGGTVYQEWSSKYEGLMHASEDFVTHYAEKYDGRLPIWVAIELLDFGALSRLLGFALQADRGEIGRSFGLANPNLIISASKVFNYLRNTSAHHSRLWNRALTYQIRAIPPVLAPDLAHLAQIVPAQQKKIYRPLAALAYVTRPIPGVDRSIAFKIRDLIDDFPKNSGLSPELHMGFLPGWRELPLWT